MTCDQAQFRRPIEYLNQVIDAVSALAYLFPKSSPSRADLLDAVVLVSRARDMVGQGGEEVALYDPPDQLPAKTRAVISVAKLQKELGASVGARGGAEIIYRLADSLACER